MYFVIFGKRVAKGEGGCHTKYFNINVFCYSWQARSQSGAGEGGEGEVGVELPPCPIQISSFWPQQKTCLFDAML